MPLGIAPFLFWSLNYTEERECPRLKGVTGPCRILFQLAAFPPAVPGMANKIYQSQGVFKVDLLCHSHWALLLSFPWKVVVINTFFMDKGIIECLNMMHEFLWTSTVFGKSYIAYRTGLTLLGKWDSLTTVALSKVVGLFMTQLSHLKMYSDKGQVNRFREYVTVLV